MQGGQDAAVAARVEPVGEVSPNFCAKCGGRLAAAAKFCSACGKAITIPQDDLAKLVQDLSRKRNEVQLERPIQLTSHPVPTAVPEQHYNATPPVVIQSPTKFALPRKDGDWGWLTFVCALVATMLLWVLIDNLPHVHNANTFKLPLAAAAGECFAFYLLGLVCTAIIAGFRKTRVSKRDVTYASWVFAFLALVGSWTITPEAPQLPPLPAGYTLDAPAAQPSPQSPPTNAPPVDPATQNSQATLKPYTGEVFPTQAQAEQDLARRLDARAAQWYKVYPFLDVNSPQANQAAIDDVLMRRDMLIRAGTEPVAALDAAVRETMAQPQADGAQAVVARTRSTETDNRPKWEQLMCPNPYTYVKPYDLCCLNADPKGTCVRPKT